MTRDSDTNRLYIDGKLLESRTFQIPAQQPGGMKRGRKRRIPSE